MSWVPVLVRDDDRGGRPVLRLGHPQLDRYLGFVAARAHKASGVGCELEHRGRQKCPLQDEEQRKSLRCTHP